MASKSLASVDELQKELSQRKKVFAKVGDKLPDGGAKLKKTIEDLEILIEKLSINEKDSCSTPGEVSEQGEKLSSDLKNKDTGRKSLEKSLSSSAKNEQSAKSHDKGMDRKSDVNIEGSQKPHVVCIRKDAGDGKINLKEVMPKSNMNNTERTSSTSPKASSIKQSDKSAEKLLSFSDLSKKAEPYSVAQFHNSPSFKDYRSESSVKKGIRLTEAAPLPSHLLTKQQLKMYQKLGTSYIDEQKLASAKEDAVSTIHGSLKSCPSQTDEEPDPAGLKTQLMKHQRQALSWLLWRETQAPSGGIFADDMGLGKTLTMISLILKSPKSDIGLCDKNEDVCGGTLVVCPASLVNQWNSEISRHCKERSLKVLMYQGANRVRDATYIAQHDVVISSYELLRTEGQAMKTKGKISPVLTIAWNRTILDEAHVIKNHKSVTALWIYEIKSKCRWAVTGTPIHNDLADMYSLLKFLRCAPFDEQKIWKKLISDFSERSIERRDALVKSILYRRCKDQVDENGTPLVKLPKKHTFLYTVVLSESEKDLYKNIFSRSQQKVLCQEQGTKDLGKKQGAISKKSENNRCSASTVVVLLLRLQQCCNHPSLLGSEVEDHSESSMSDILNDFSSLNISEKKKNGSGDGDSAIDLTFNESMSSFPISKESSKIHKLLKKLKKISVRSNGKDKSVVVSQWVSMLDIVATHLEASNIKYNMIKGGMKPDERMAVIEDFNFNPEGAPVILLSLKAGGVGLNLIGGNHLFLLDLHWNPALETQVCDRVYRVGQHKEVFIHKFVCKDTIEEKIVEMQMEKKRLAKNVLSGGKNVRDHLTYEDIRELFKI